MLKKEYRYSFKKGVPRNTVSSPLFTVRYQKSSDTHVHCGVVVSKKVSMLATERNRLKRLTLEILSKELQVEKIPFDLVFYLKKEIMKEGKEKIANELAELIQKIH